MPTHHSRRLHRFLTRSGPRHTCPTSAKRLPTGEIQYGCTRNMGISDTNEHVLPETEFAGEISINGETTPITFRASAGPDCRLCINAGDIEPRAYFFVVRNQGVPGASHEEFTLRGTSADGQTIASENVFVRAYGHNDDRRWIDLRSRGCKITLPLQRCVKRPVLRRWCRSFRSFRNPSIETSLGNLTVWGKAQDVAPDDMSGGINLEAPSGCPGDDWRQKADDLLSHMHRGLALAHGGAAANAPD